MRPLVYLYHYVFPAIGDSLRRAELVGSQFQRRDPGPAGRCRLVSGVTGRDLNPRGSPWALALGPSAPPSAPTRPSSRSAAWGLAWGCLPVGEPGDGSKGL